MRCITVDRQLRPPGVHPRRRRSTARSSTCGQCHVDSRRRKLNTDLFCVCSSGVSVRRATWSSTWRQPVTEWAVSDRRAPPSGCRCAAEWCSRWSTSPACGWHTATWPHATCSWVPASTWSWRARRCVWTCSRATTSCIVGARCRCAGPRPRPWRPASTGPRRPRTCGRSASWSGSCSLLTVLCRSVTDQTPTCSPGYRHSPVPPLQVSRA